MYPPVTSRTPRGFLFSFEQILSRVPVSLSALGLCSEPEGPMVQVRRGRDFWAFSGFSAFVHAMTLIIAKHKKAP